MQIQQIICEIKQHWYSQIDFASTNDWLHLIRDTSVLWQRLRGSISLKWQEKGVWIVGYILGNQWKASERIKREGLSFCQLSLLVFLHLTVRGGNIRAVTNASSLSLPYLSYWLMQSRTGNKEERGKNMNFIEFKDRKSFTCNGLACTILQNSLVHYCLWNKNKKTLERPKPSKPINQNQTNKTNKKNQQPHNLNISQQWRGDVETCAILFAKLLVTLAQKHTEIARKGNHPPKLQYEFVY